VRDGPTNFAGWRVKIVVDPNGEKIAPFDIDTDEPQFAVQGAGAGRPAGCRPSFGLAGGLRARLGRRGRLGWPAGYGAGGLWS
jgi:hypothetical protein